MSDTRPAPSFRNNFAARLGADIFGLVTSLAAATITARVLGPSGRGYYSSLVLVAVLVVQLFNGGLGEAAIVLPKRDDISEKTAVSATVAALLPLGLLGALVMYAFAGATLNPETSNERVALILAAVLVLLNTLSTTMSWLLIAKERLVWAAAVTVLSGTVTTLAIYILTAVLKLKTAGAILAAVLGCAATFIPLTRALGKERVSLRPRWNGRYLRSAARFGLAVQVSNLLVQMTGRLDLLFVFRIGGSAAAGRYSVALTIGTLVAAVPTAIAHASFPRLPKLGEDEARVLTAGLFRSGVAAALACAAVLTALTPVALPLVFGPAYNQAIVPTLVLIPGGVLWSAQWIIARAAAARGNAKPLFVSYFVSFVVMIGLDLLLIDRFGMIGAAVASLIASGTGFLIAWRHHGWPARDLVPRVADLVAMLRALRQMLGALRGATAQKPVDSPRSASWPE